MMNHYFMKNENSIPERIRERLTQKSRYSDPIRIISLDRAFPSKILYMTFFLPYYPTVTKGFDILAIFVIALQSKIQSKIEFFLAGQRLISNNKDELPKTFDRI